MLCGQILRRLHTSRWRRGCSALGGLCRAHSCFFARRLVEQALCRFVLEFIRQRDVSGRSETTYVVTVFVLDTEQRPNTSTNDFRKGDEESDDRRLLYIVAEDDVKDPVAAEYRIDDHGSIVPPHLLVCKVVSQEWVLG